MRFATAFARLEGLAALSFALVRERARQSRVTEVPGFGDPATAPIGEWPGCVSLYHASTSVLVTALRGIPGIGPDAVLATLKAADLFGRGLETLTTREALDLHEMDAVLAKAAEGSHAQLPPSPAPGPWKASARPNARSSHSAAGQGCAS
jgi:hypothetical protein